MYYAPYIQNSELFTNIVIPSNELDNIFNIQQNTQILNNNKFKNKDLSNQLPIHSDNIPTQLPNQSDNIFNKLSNITSNSTNNNILFDGFFILHSLNQLLTQIMKDPDYLMNINMNTISNMINLYMTDYENYKQSIQTYIDNNPNEKVNINEINNILSKYKIVSNSNNNNLSISNIKFKNEMLGTGMFILYFLDFVYQNTQLYNIYKDIINNNDKDMNEIDLAKILLKLKEQTYNELNK